LTHKETKSAPSTDCWKLMPTMNHTQRNVLFCGNLPPSPEVTCNALRPSKKPTIFNSHSLRATLILRTANAKTAPGEKNPTLANPPAAASCETNSGLIFYNSSRQLCNSAAKRAHFYLSSRLFFALSHTHAYIYFTLEGERSLACMYVCHWRLSYCTKIYTRHAA
jgi:hypothetical protein